MKNWLGQDILVGDYVYRGARDGNSSSFKAGKVIKVDEANDLIRINWLYEPRAEWINRVRHEYVRRMDYKSTMSINSLVKLSDDVVDYLSGVAR